MAATGPEEYRDVIGDALDRVAELVVRHLEDRQRLSRNAAAVLDRLDREGPVRLTVLAVGAGVSQPAMTELVQRLSSQGLVTRVSDPADGRAALVGITAAGRALLADRLQERRNRLADLLATLPEEAEPALALAMHVALPIVQRLIHNAAQAATPTGLARPQGRDGNETGRTARAVRRHDGDP
jgi:DNA-binding MarR family transcriptional regulator